MNGIIVQVDAFFNSAFFQDELVFYFIVILLMGVLGLLSRSGAVASFGAYLTFTLFATETRNAVLLTAFFAVTIILLVYLGSQALSFATGETS